MNDPRVIDFTEYSRLDEQSRKLFLLQFAILAPSTHNSQPWIFSIKENVYSLYKNPQMNLPQGDKEGRDMYISLGCAIENLVLAGESYGLRGEVMYGPFSEGDKVAEILFPTFEPKPNGYDEVTLNSIRYRTNARGLFKNEKVPESLVQKLSILTTSDQQKEGIRLHFILDAESIKKIAELTATGLRQAYRNKDFRLEMSQWMNSSLSMRKDGIPGWALKMPFFLSFIIPTLIKYVDIGEKLATLNRLSISSVPLIAVFTASQDTQKNWLEVGRLAERVMIEVHKAGFQTSIFVASIEMDDLYKEVQNIIHSSDRPQFLMVIGKVNSLHKPTPRFSVHDKMRVV